MKTLLLVFSILAMVPAMAAGGPALLFDGYGNPISSTTGALNVSGSFTASNPSIGTTGAAVPGSETYIGGSKAGNLTGLLIGQQTMANSLACVLPSDQSAIPVTGTFWQATQPVSGTVTANIGTSGSLALDASVTGLQVSQGSATLGEKGSLIQGAVTTAAPAYTTAQTSPLSLTTAGALRTDGSGATQPISAASLPLPTGAATSAKQPALGTAGTASTDVLTVQGIASMTALKVDGSAVTQPVSGTVTANVQGGNVTAVKVDGSAVTQPVSAASLPLPTGAATSALQTTISGQLPATLGQKTMAASMAAVIASDQSAIPTKAPVSVTGSGAAAAATVSTVITLTAPANAVGAFLMNLDTSTANLRWAVGRTATTTLGQQLQPGRDVWIPTGASISLVAESGTQNYDVQWISQ